MRSVGDDQITISIIHNQASGEQRTWLNILDFIKRTQRLHLRFTERSSNSVENLFVPGESEVATCSGREVSSGVVVVGQYGIEPCTSRIWVDSIRFKRDDVRLRRGRRGRLYMGHLLRIPGPGSGRGERRDCNRNENEQSRYHCAEELGNMVIELTKDDEYRCTLRYSVFSNESIKGVFAFPERRRKKKKDRGK